jgi:hypothetical protein
MPQFRIPERFEETSQFRKPFGPDPIETARAFAAFRYETRVFQHREVLRDGRPCDREVGSDFAGREFPNGDERENFPPSAICQCLNSGVHTRMLA